MTEVIEPAITFGAAATQTETETIRRYDRQRRQRLLILMGTTFGSLIGALFVLLAVLIAIAGTFGVSEIVELSGTALNALLFVAVVALARREHVEWAAALFAIGAVVLPNLIIAASATTGAGSPFNVAFLVGAITIASLAGRPWMVFVAALLASLTTTYIVLAPLPTPTPARVSGVAGRDDSANHVSRLLGPCTAPAGAVALVPAPADGAGRRAHAGGTRATAGRAERPVYP
jgi:hypothetical protein